MAYKDNHKLSSPKKFGKGKGKPAAPPPDPEPEEEQSAADDDAGDDSARDSDDELLAEIRENYSYADKWWKDKREHRKKCLRYLDGSPWEDKDRREREEARRPCINHDELNQYIFQCVNSARQNKRGARIEPAGNGANDKSAEFRQGVTRAIEYNSKAPQIYLRAYQDCVEGSYGFCRISRRYLKYDSDDQEIVVKPIPNPDAVLYDPDCEEPDWRDAKFCFVLDPMTSRQFRRRFPKAKVQSFGREHFELAPEWLGEDKVLCAEYWRVETSDTGKKTAGGRAIEKTEIVQYWTNGVEILERNPQPGEEIPIPVFVGLDRYVDDGGGPTRKLYSLISFALDPQMTLAYLCTLEVEEGGLTPKAPFMGYTGQFETDNNAWKNLTKEPVAFIQVDPLSDINGGQPLPLPQRVQFTPNFQAYEVAKESARRAIQAAVAISPLPTAAQRQNEKSGVALDKIHQAEAVGSFHFVDGLDRGVERAGRIIDSWLNVTYDTEREIPMRKVDDTQRVVRANTAQPYKDPATGEEYHYRFDEGDHDVTVSSGPSDISQREAAAEFLDQLINNLKNLPVAPPQAAKLLALAIQMKQLGPKGDEMAEIISPDPNAPLQPQAMAAIQQAHTQLQGLALQLAETRAELQKLQQEKLGKVVDNEYRLQLEQLKIDAQLAAAEITTKAQQLEERMQFVHDVWQQLHGQAHDVALQEHQQQHDASMQQQQQQATADQQQTQFVQQQAAADQQPQDSQ